MTAGSHILFGAAVGVISPGYGSAFGLGLLSHLFLDIIPHTEQTTFLNEEDKKQFRWVVLIAVADFILASLVLFLLIYGGQTNYIIKAGLGAFGGFLIDLIDVVIGKTFCKRFREETRFGQAVRKIHNTFHRDIKREYWLLGLLPYAGAAIIAITILLKTH